MGTMTTPFNQKMKIKIYSHDEIRAMRTFLKESRSVFADRFFLTAETIKGWELGRRNASGPALVILQQIEEEVKRKREEGRKTLAQYRRELRVNKKAPSARTDRASRHNTIHNNVIAIKGE